MVLGILGGAGDKKGVLWGTAWYYWVLIGTGWYWVALGVHPRERFDRFFTAQILPSPRSGGGGKKFWENLCILAPPSL